MIRTESNEAWAARLAGKIPASWRGFLLAEWQARRAAFDAATATGEGDASRAANVELRETIASLTGLALPLKASDEQVCAVAARYADKCQGARVTSPSVDAQRDACALVCLAAGIEPAQGPGMGAAGAVARMCAPNWWRGRLRRLLAQRVEAAAIKLGRVRKGRECYVSDESMSRRKQQNARNRAMLDNTQATNENGDEFTLAELSERGVSNPAIRRAELMTRINGCEQIAAANGHAAEFITITCPSRMHRWRDLDGGKFVKNRRYDGTLPNAAQAYLSGVFARIRAAMGHAGLRWYGFRVAEPHHDGCPHWHLLVFMAPADGARVRGIVRQYALEESPDEPGAQARRVTFKSMDPLQGGASAYIAKYISKNIDGHAITDDRNGNTGRDGAARVQAWAATWRIRQFQPIGQAPVTVWREIRRVQALPDDAPRYLFDAHDAANKATESEGGAGRVSWATYVQAQGGVFVGRGYRIRLLTEQTGEYGRYGEVARAAPVGVECVDVLPDGNVLRTVAMSKRYVWTVKRGGAGWTASGVPIWAASAVFGLSVVSERASMRASAVERSSGFEGLSAGLSAPWTCVNNCTDGARGGAKNDGRKSEIGARTDARGASKVAAIGGSGGKKLFRRAGKGAEDAGRAHRGGRQW